MRSYLAARLALLNRRDWSLFSKIFAALIGVSIVPVIACSLLFYFVSRHSVETEVSLSNLETLKQTQMAVDNILEATERISVQIVRNKEVLNFMNNRFEKTRQGNTPAITNAINVADSFAEGVQYIDSISIYSFLNNALVSSGTRRYTEMDASFLDNYGNSLKTKGFTMWIEPDDTEVFGETSQSLQFVEFIFETFNRPEGIVLIKLKNDEFAKLINDMYIRKSGYIFVVNNKGKVILGRNRLPEAFDPAAFLSEYKTTPEGHYKIDRGGQQLLVSFTTSRYNQWKYVAVLPANEIVDRTSLLGQIIAGLCLLFVGLAVLLSFAASKGIYNPISALDRWLRGSKSERHKLDSLKVRKDELGRIQQELDDKIAKLRHYFLYRLTYGGITDKTEILSQANFLDIPADQVYVVLLLEPDKSDGSQPAALPAVLETVQAALAASVSLVNTFAETRDDKDRIVSVAAFDADRPAEEIWPVLRAAVASTQQELAACCRATFTAAVGSARKGLENIQQSYNDANEVLKYKFVKGASAVIFSSELAGGASLDPHKYYSKNRLINCLDARDKVQLAKLLADFKAGMKENISAKTVYVFYCKDIISIFRDYLEGLGSRFANEKSELAAMFGGFEKRYDDIDTAVADLLGCLERVIAKLEQETPEAAKRRAVEKAVEIIETEYAQDISLTYVCSKLGISEPYCSKIFKEEHGINFKDYLTSVRIAKARELLRGTGLPIGVIAAQVGYCNHNQFAKMFKRYEGVTPGAYRQAAAVKAADADD